MPNTSIEHLFANNRAWAAEIKARQPGFFEALAQQQAPKYLWIGCSDSRVPANQIVGLLPGDIFVHRNVANVVAHTDLNCLSVIQFAVDVLQVEHILVVGHYGCGGVRAALSGQRLGMVDNWLRHVQDVRDKHGDILGKPDSTEGRETCLCELNVIEQVVNVCQSTIVQDAWERGAELTVHGWVYAVQDGLAQDLGMSVSSAAELSSAYVKAILRRSSGATQRGA